MSLRAVSVFGACLAAVAGGCGGEDGAAPPSTAATTPPATTGTPLGPWHASAPVPVDDGVGNFTRVVFEGDHQAADVIAGSYFVPVPSSNREAIREYLNDGTAVVGTPQFDATGRGVVVVFTRRRVAKDVWSGSRMGQTA